MMARILLSCVFLLSVSFLLVSGHPGGNAVERGQAGFHNQEEHAAPELPQHLTKEGLLANTVANPPHVDHREKLKKKLQPQQYRQSVDFLGSAAGVPLNPTEHLKKSLEEDKKYIASILRSPLDLGDPTDCKHSDIVRDEKELRKIALRINHRRTSLAQQSHWIDHATDGLKNIESEIASTTDTARNLAEQLDALTAQKDDILHHVRRKLQLRELDNQSSTLMRLKNARMKEEIRLQKKHNKFAIKNYEHNQVLEKLDKMRTQQGLALGQLHDPKPYRFMEVESNSEETQQADNEAEQEAETEAEGEVESEDESTSEESAEAETEADAGAEAEGEAEESSDEAAETEAEAEESSE